MAGDDPAAAAPPNSVAPTKEQSELKKGQLPHVLIIGAGVTGLLLAQALKKDSIPFTIFDSETPAQRARTREWGMSIHWSRPLLETLLPQSLLSRLSEAQVDPSFDSSRAEGYTVPFYNGKTGEHIVELPMRNCVRVRRRGMRELLEDGIDVKVNETLTSITHPPNTGTITADFSSGLSATGTLLIGTDGPQSTVRELLLGAEKAKAQQVEVVMYNMHVTYGDAEKAKVVRSLHPVNTVAIQPDKGLSVWTSIQSVPDPEKPETWSFQIMPTWLDDGKVHHSGAAGLAELKEIAMSLEDPWRSSILWIPEEGTEIKPSKVAYWVTVPWDNWEGRVTLGGDAAHPLPPHRGQGLNHCIADIANFVKAVKVIADGTTTPSEAITAYDEEVVKRGGGEVEMSRKNALLVHDYDKFMESPVLKMGYVRDKGVGK